MIINGMKTIVNVPESWLEDKRKDNNKVKKDG